MKIKGASSEKKVPNKEEKDLYLYSTDDYYFSLFIRFFCFQKHKYIYIYMTFLFFLPSKEDLV